MSIVSRVTLKTYFETGDVPTQAQFIDLIDTLFALADNNIVTTAKTLELSTDSAKKITFADPLVSTMAIQTPAGSSTVPALQVSGATHGFSFSTVFRWIVNSVTRIAVDTAGLIGIGSNITPVSGQQVTVTAASATKAIVANTGTNTAIEANTTGTTATAVVANATGSTSTAGTRAGDFTSVKGETLRAQQTGSLNNDIVTAVLRVGRNFSSVSATTSTPIFIVEDNSSGNTGGDMCRMQVGGTVMFQVSHDGDIATGDPGAGNDFWRLGTPVPDTYTPDLTTALEVMVGGNVYYIALVTPP